MNTYSHIFSWILFILLLAFGAKAEDNSANQLTEQYNFKHLDIVDGLSNNQVKSILKDKRGFMWFGTERGLNRYDGSNFKVYLHDLYDPNSIPFNSVDYLFEDTENKIWIKTLNDFTIYDPDLERFERAAQYYKNTKIPLSFLQSLFKDRQGNLWFVSGNYGLYRYGSDQSVDSVAYKAEYPGEQANNYLNRMEQDAKGNYWVVSNTGVVLQLDANDYHLLKSYQLNDAVRNQINNFQLYIDTDDDVWLYSPGLPYGVFRIVDQTNKIENYSVSSKTLALSHNLVSSVTQDDNGFIWLATDHGGINIIDKRNQTISYLLNDQNDPNSISQNSVTCLYRDTENIIWAGTFKKGVNFFHKNLIRFKHYNQVLSDPNSLPYNDVNCFAEDKKGNLWIGTNGGGLIYFDRENNQFKTFKNDPKNPASLSNNVIVSLLIDRDNILWIGTYFGGLCRYDGQKFTSYQHDPENPSSLSDDRVWDIVEDSKQNLWLGTLGGGLNLFDRQKNIFYRYTAEDVNSVRSNFVVSIIEDHENNLWFGTSDGLDQLVESNKRFQHYAPDPGIPGKLRDKNVIDLLEDVRGLIWIGTHQGLNVLDKKTSEFKVFTENDGLASGNIKTIQEDQSGNIWISTTNGLSKITVLIDDSNSFNKLRIKVDNFNLKDGLQGIEYNEKAVYRTRAGELIFGGANGFNLFVPEDIQKQELTNQVVLTGFKIFNKEVKANQEINKHIVLNRSINNTEEITLRHNENVFSVEFEALNFFQPEKNIFEYRLIGFNDEWLKVDQRLHEVTFTNLNAGTYQLQIRVSDDGSNWTQMQPDLTLKILPSFWNSKIAYAIYFILLAAIILVSRRIMLDRHRLKFEAEHEHREAERIQQLDNLKTRFFTNVSHEFRTPLTLILSPLEQLLSQSKDDEMKSHLILIYRNAKRLLSMVNQLLDFRKMEVQKLEAKNSWGEMIAFIREVSASFEDLVNNKHIKFSFHSRINELHTYFDQDKTYKIISNLLSNAFKFTPDGGEVSLKIDLIDEDKTQKTAKIRLTVKDSGIGIDPKLKDKIFDRYYQHDVPSSIVNQGSGIGLSMVSEYVHIMGGNVSVESEMGKGSTFEIIIPVKLFSIEEIKENLSLENKAQNQPSIQTSKSIRNKKQAYDSQKRTILLVEDNPDFLFYLKDNLIKQYNILEAENGNEGWDLAEQHIPDLVVSDIMMPLTDGLQLCSKIKNNRNTNHIPVILLTAKTETEPVIEGFESGADDYISKPFDFRLLETRISNLIEQRDKLRLTFQSMIGINPEKIEVKSQDEKFIKKALEIVEKYISEPSFSVEDMGLEMGMSRVSLYKKILALTNKTPIEFIRIIRLKRAVDLLTSTQLSVSEIAYNVGFNNPRYFSKYFSKQYGMLPSEYISRHRNEKIRISDETRDKFR